jgi:hypothetical protein
MTDKCQHESVRMNQTALSMRKSLIDNILTSEGGTGRRIRKLHNGDEVYELPLLECNNMQIKGLGHLCLDFEFCLEVLICPVMILSIFIYL